MSNLKTLSSILGQAMQEYISLVEKVRGNTMIQNIWPNLLYEWFKLKINIQDCTSQKFRLEPHQKSKVRAHFNDVSQIIIKFSRIRRSSIFLQTLIYFPLGLTSAMFFAFIFPPQICNYSHFGIWDLYWISLASSLTLQVWQFQLFLFFISIQVYASYCIFSFVLSFCIDRKSITY